MRVIIVDDEAPARRYVQRLLQAHTDIEVTGQAASRTEAEVLIAEQQPDAVFMDIELGDGSGMTFWATLTKRPLVIFITAHPDHAWRAFDVEAVDYVLKPVSPTRFNAAIDKLRVAHGAPPKASAPPAKTGILPPAATESHQQGKTLIFKSSGNTRVVRIDSISAAIASRDYVELKMEHQQSALVYRTLTKIAQDLPCPPFYRLSRSLLVNVDHIVRITNSKHLGSAVLFSTDPKPLEIGHIAVARLKKILG